MRKINLCLGEERKNLRKFNTSDKNSFEVLYLTEKRFALFKHLDTTAHVIEGISFQDLIHYAITGINIYFGIVSVNLVLLFLFIVRSKAE